MARDFNEVWTELERLQEHYRKGFISSQTFLVRMARAGRDSKTVLVKDYDNAIVRDALTRL